MKEIGKKIKKKRLELNLSQKGLADKAKVTSQTIINIEQGKRITMETLKQVCKALGLTIEIE